MEKLEEYIPIVKFIASMMGENCEVLLHDVRNPENSIVAIENGHISGRRVGGVLTDLVLKIVHNKEYQNQDFIANYVVVAKDNRICQSSSLLIRDENREIIGALCVNIDITALLATKRFLSEFIKIKPPKELKNMLSIKAGSRSSDEDIGETNGEENEILEHLLETSGDVVELLIGKVLNKVTIPVERMSQDEKIQAVRELNELGLFLFKGGVSELAKRLKVSDTTVYRYLHKIKDEEEKG